MKKIFIYLLATFLLVFAVSAVQVYRTLKNYKQGREEYDHVFELAVQQPDDSVEKPATEIPNENENEFPDIFIDHQLMKALNDDYRGWLRIPGTNIDYPVVWYGNNEYYLSRTFLGNYNAAGCIFLDNRTDSFDLDHVVIYGHRMNDGSMFADLRNFLDDDYLDERRDILILTETETILYEIFSARKVEVTDECFTFYFINDTGYGSWFNKMISFSPYNAATTQDTKEIITLSTCVYNDESSRLIIQAFLIGRYPSKP